MGDSQRCCHGFKDRLSLRSDVLVWVVFGRNHTKYLTTNLKGKSIEPRNDLSSFGIRDHPLAPVRDKAYLFATDVRTLIFHILTSW